MSRVALFGVGPLPVENPDRIHGTSMRVWHFARPLMQAGHEVHLLAMRSTNRESQDTSIKTASLDGVSYTLVDEVAHFHKDAFIQEYLNEVKPNAVVGVNLFPAVRACQCAGNLPVWADLNGFALGEAQMKAAQECDDFYLRHFWSYERVALLHADRFSTCSTPQMYALAGELALAGRLNCNTAGYRFIDVVPNARSLDAPHDSGFRLRGNIVDRNAHIVLWSGGYNTWLDSGTMLECLLLAMDRDEAMHYVSTGGTLDGYDEITYPAFKRAAGASRHSKRFHFLDWIPSGDLPGCLADADVGINVDCWCYESLIGARNRLTDMLKAGLPIVTTLASEISHAVKDAGAGVTFPCDDAEVGAKALLSLVGDEERKQRMKQAARALFEQAYTDTISVASLLQWLENPQKAPDAGNPSQPLTWPEPTNQAKPNLWRRIANKAGEYRPE
jgi:glycosyltransferase involved in cell wall biosynthesis